MKKNILYFVFICLIVFEVYCEKLPYIKYANNYNVSDVNLIQLKKIKKTVILIPQYKEFL